ncbi:MAG TPA: hypothetical protein VKR23_01615 [Gaiellaceae bacterium]|nr:hypothetical protein [Gaiellaceae bacterium]
MEAWRLAGDGYFPRPRLGDLLARKGLIKPEELEDALTESQTSGELLGRVLIRRGTIFEDELARTLAEQLHLPYVNLHVVGVDAGVARMIPPEEGRRAAAIPVSMIGGRVRVAFADPSDETAREIVEHFLQAPYEAAVGELSDIDRAWRVIGQYSRNA